MLLDAFAMVVRRQPAARLIMVGSGPLELFVRRKIEQLGLTASVRLLGDVVATDIMPAFDVFCLSSRYEGMPYVILEAVAAGLPVVATRVGGVDVCVEPGKNGLLVPPDDPTALAAALTKLVKDGELRRHCAAASECAAHRFTSERMVARTLQVYEQVIAARGR